MHCLSDAMLLADPWDSPPLPVDAELVAVSQQLMAQFQPEPLLQDETPMDKQELQIRQLEADKQRLLERNVILKAEVAQLRATNQRLNQKVAQMQQQQTSWLGRFFQQFKLKS
jgi:predicted RNase H-like nuclease (RuvC/YqgF family)